MRTSAHGPFRNLISPMCRHCISLCLKRQISWQDFVFADTVGAAILKLLSLHPCLLCSSKRQTNQTFRRNESPAMDHLLVYDSNRNTFRFFALQKRPIARKHASFQLHFVRLNQRTFSFREERLPRDFSKTIQPGNSNFLWLH